MAPKRAAKKAAPPPPPPPPPAESSDDETRSGSRSRSDESEDEEVIADSPVAAATPALKNAPAPSQKGGESESSEEESDDEEEEEEEPVREAPSNQPPPPQKKEDSDASGSEEEEEEEKEEEEEEEKEEEPAPKKQPPPALKNQPPPAPKKTEESDASDEEEDEEDEEEALPPKPAPKKDLKPPASASAAAETKKPGGIQRIWSTNDEVRILEALAAHQKQHGTFPQPDALMDVLAGKLDNPAYGSKELQSKVKALRHRYLTLSRRGEVPSKEHDRQLLHLSKLAWTGDKITSPVATTGTAIVKAANNGQERKGFEEMCELYPYLAEEVKELEAVHPGLCKREFGKMDDDKARAMDEKVKRQRVAQIRLEMRRSDLAKEVTKALVDLVDG